VQIDEYRRMFELEDDYWWFVARRRLAMGLLQTALSSEDSPPRPTVLDLGCGTGVVLREMREWASAVGLDMSDVALSFCRRRGLSDLVVARGECLPLKADSVEGVIALDILEHIPDDRSAFREVFRVLKPGGALVLSVPAFMTLWGPHDVALMHQRRYRAGGIRRLLKDAGFEVERLSHSIFLLFPVVLAIRLVEKLKRGTPQASLPAVPRWFNRALIGVQAWEAALIGRMSLPWGSSIVAVARKPLRR
jgi:SAM-dependent methyltransferase